MNAIVWIGPGGGVWAVPSQHEFSKLWEAAKASGSADVLKANRWQAGEFGLLDDEP